MAIQRRSIVWVDANGQTTLSQPRGSATLTSLQAAIQVCSNAAVSEEWEGTDNITVGPSPSSGVYQSVKDTATLIFQTASGNNVKLVIPAPQSGIFMADQYTVDPTNVLIVSLIMAALAVLVDPSGAAVVLYIGGTRNG